MSLPKAEVEPRSESTSRVTELSLTGICSSSNELQGTGCLDRKGVTTWQRCYKWWTHLRATVWNRWLREALPKLMRLNLCATKTSGSGKTAVLRTSGKGGEKCWNDQHGLSTVPAHSGQ